MASPSSSSGSSLSPTPSAVFVPPQLRNGGIVYLGVGRGGVNSGSLRTPVVGLSKQNGGMKIRMMTCHMDWIKDLMPMYLSPQEKGTYLTGIVQALRLWLIDIERKIVTPGMRINIRMMLACFYAYLEQFNEALDWINGAIDDSLEALPGEGCKTPHLQAYSYLLRSNFYKINRRMKLMEGMNMKLVEEGSAQELKEIEGMYRANEEAFQAAICFAKGMLAKVMAYQDKQIELFRNATVLEPSCAQWHRALYVALRKKRRESGPRGGSYLSPEEVMAITRAYDLDTDSCLNQSMYAGMLEEKMKSRQDLVLSNVKEETCDEIISLMRSALEKNPEDEWTHVRLAEIYAYGHYPHLDPKEGEHMFEELEERWPKNSMVLHKFGKYFAGMQNKPLKALDYYTRALDCDLGNFPCLMDYLKTCRILGNGHEDMLAMVEKCLCSGYLYNDGPFIKIMLTKGILLWILDKNDGGTGKQEACKAWIVATEKDLASSVWIAKTIASGRWNVIGEYSIDLNQLCSILNVFLCLANEQEQSNHEQAKAIERLISEIRNQGTRDSQAAIRFGLRNRNHNSTSSSRSSVSNYSYVTAKTSFSQADSVSNWREPAPQIPPLIDGNGIFAKYEDPMELRFRGGFHPGYKLGLTTVPSLQSQHKFASGRGGGGDGKKISQADLDDDWRH